MKIYISIINRINDLNLRLKPENIFSNLLMSIQYVIPDMQY